MPKTRCFLKRDNALMFCAALFLISVRGLAQVTTADIVGTITDSTGAVVPGAKITLTNLHTAVKAATHSNQTGDYVFNLLLPGTYSISIEAPGFKTFVIPSVTLAAGDRARENGGMETGAVTERVEVMGTAPLLQTDTSSVGSVVTEQAVQDLPLNGRNYISLVQIQPGVNAGPPNAISSGTRPDDRRQTSTVAANGNSDLFNNEMVDGMDNNEREQGFIGIRPSIEAIAEINVKTNTYAADLGRNAGAVVNIITKSGTNQYHGSAYEFFRNDILDGRDFFAKEGVTNKPKYRQNQFGASIGGPIIRGSTFFFGDFEGLRIIQGRSSGLLTVPTLYEAQHPGDFSDINGPVIPSAAIDPVGLAYFKLFPAPNVPGATTVNNFESAPNQTQYAWTADGRVDQHFRNGDTLYGRYTYNNVNTYVPTPFPSVSENGVSILPGGGSGFFGPSIAKPQEFQLNYVHAFTPQLIMELKAGYLRINNATHNPNPGNVSSAIGVIGANTPSAPESEGLMPVAFQSGGYASMGDAQYVPILNINNVFQYMGAVNYTRGGHNIKAGGGVIRRQLNYFQAYAPMGRVTFATTTGNSLGDLLSGTPLGYSRTILLFKPGYRLWEPSAYMQDDWRVNRKLTLNLGVRYDIFTSFTEAQNRLSNFLYPTLHLVLGSSDPHVGVNTSHTNVSPRIGFSQSLDNDTVVRGGYGITYYPSSMQAVSQQNNPPYNYSVTCQPCASFWPSIPLPVPSSVTNLSGSLQYEGENLNTLLVHQFNLMVQRQIGANVVTLGYVGNITRRMRFTTTINRPDPNGPYPNDVTDGPPPVQPLLTATSLPNVGTISGNIDKGFANYNSLQAVFARRFTRGLGFNANYTWAHGLGNGENGSSSNTIYGLVPTDPQYDYGNSTIDIRQRFAVSVNYALPFAGTATGRKAWLLGGWNTNFVYFWQTGIPFTVTNAFLNRNGVAQSNLIQVTADRPDMLGQPIMASDPNNQGWFNIAAFTPQQAGTAGNEDMNQLYGPHARRADLSLFKSFNLTESKTLQFRAECYNISNTPNFSVPNGTIRGWNPGPGHDATNPISKVGLLPGDVPTTAGGLGTITSTVYGINPRQFQFALKFLF